MDIIAPVKAERDKTAQQVNALDTAIRALSGMNSARRLHGLHGQEFRHLKKHVGHARPEGCLHCAQASHFSGRFSAD